MALGKGLNSLIPEGQQKNKRKTRKKQTVSAESSTDRVWQIPLSDIVPNPEQPRKHFDHSELEDLIASIKKHGILQPVTVTEREDGGYELIAGERRMRASEVAGLATIPAIVRNATEQEKLELALIENIQRHNLNPIEEGFAYERLIDEFGLTQQEVADQVGKSRSAVANMIRLLDLPEPIKKGLVDGKLSAGKARALLSLKDEQQQLDMFASMMGEKMSVRDVEQAVSQKSPKSRKGSVRRDPNVMAKEEDLEAKYGTKVRITQRGEKGTITMEYYSKQQLKDLLDALM